MMPSREFLTQQATLTALHDWYPVSVRVSGVAYVGKRVADLIAAGDCVGTLIVKDIRARFSRIASQYERNAA